jgi:hypothetical protein
MMGPSFVISGPMMGPSLGPTGPYCVVVVVV